MKSLRTAALGLAALLAGCGGASTQQFNPQAELIKTIALASVPNPAQYQAVDWGGKASLFGAAGGLATQADAKTMTETLTRTAKEANFDYSRAMQAALASSLKRAGFSVVAAGASADALLEINPRVVGYSTYNIKDPDFRPHIQLDVRLVSAKTRNVLYSEQLLFGYSNPYISATHLPSDKQYFFSDFGALMASKSRAIEGLRRGTEALAAHIAGRLKS